MRLRRYRVGRTKDSSRNRAGSTLLWVSLLLFVVIGCNRSEPGDTEEPAGAAAEVREEEPEIEEYEVDIMDDSRSVERRIEDAALEARVRLALVEARPLRPFDFQMEAVNGRVVLRGEVASDELRQQAASVAGSVGGVREVVNEISASGAAPLAQAKTDEPREQPEPQKTEPKQPEPEQPEPADTVAPPVSAPPKPEAKTPSERPNFVIRGVWREPQKPAPEEPTEQEAPKQEGQIHTVGSGDNLWTISRRYGVSINDIKRLNNLRSESLRPGQKLRVK